MRKRPYNLQLQTPLGECEAAADTMPGLVEITPRGLFGDVLGRPGKKPEDDLEIVARDLWAAFLEQSKGAKKARHTNVSRAGCELDLMKCYLQNMTVDEAVEFLQKQHGIDTSRAAVGRYWSVLSKIGLDFKARL